MPGREDVFQKSMNEGHSAAWDQDWKKAAAAYRKALQEFPDQPKALNSLGLALYQLGEFEEALHLYQHVAQFSPDDPVTWEKIGQLSERVGNLDIAIEAAMKAADAFFNQREVEKALENWSRVTILDPENILAHSRLAVVHERLGQSQAAVTEYLAIASILQRVSKPDKAMEIVTKALQLLPQSPEAKQAQLLLKSGQMLPKPIRPKGGTGPLSMAKVKQLQEPSVETNSGLDPIAEARQKALTKLAEMLFDYSDDSPSAQERRGLSAIVKGTGHLSLQQAEQTKVVLHLGQAIDAQTKNQDEIAANELEHALEAGFNHAALYFDLGYLRSTGDRLESAIRNLAHAVKHTDYGLGSRLVLGDILFKKSQFKDAALEYLEALKLADSFTVPPEQSDDIRQLYEPLIEAQHDQKDEEVNKNICKNIRTLLLRSDWRDEIYKTREQTRKGDEGSTPAPLAEVLLEAQSSNVIESINQIHQLARVGSLRSAMDEAFDAVQHAPTYLPLHTLMGDLLMQEGRTQDAIAKFSVTAHAYGVRGEVVAASKLLRRVIQLSPMDLSARTRLIDQLVAHGQVDDAINEYLELAELHYRLAELDMARKTYTNALRVVQQTNADHSWNIHILQRMADIDMQRLDWKQALRVYEQIRTLRPDDAAVRQNLIELNLRLAQIPQALAELESFISYLESNAKNQDAIPFIEKLLEEHSAQLMLQRALADELHKVGRTPEAIAILDGVGDKLMESNDKASLIEVVNRILSMNPPNADEYRSLLAQLRGN
jgi:tetratricopeptide (TPR) repeat protein